MTIWIYNGECKPAERKAVKGFWMITISLGESVLRLSGEPENLFSFVNPRKDD